MVVVMVKDRVDESWGVVDEATAPILVIARRAANIMLRVTTDLTFNANQSAGSETALINLPAKTRKTMSLSSDRLSEG